MFRGDEVGASDKPDLSKIHVDLSRMWFQAALGIDPDHQPARRALKQSHTEQPVPAAAGKK